MKQFDFKPLLMRCLVTLALVLLASVTMRAQTVNVRYVFTDSVGNPAAVNRITQTPLAPAPSINGTNINLTPVTLVTGTNGTATFSNTVVGVMDLLRDIETGKTDFNFVDPDRRGKAGKAVAKGTECILKCQIRVNGNLTAWCAQHDEHDFTPAKARTYELPSLSGEENVGIIRFLMNIEHPSVKIIQSIEAAVKWFDGVKIRGIREEVVTDTLGPEGKNRILVQDPNAPPMWARFYEIGANRHFFCSRDGIKRFNLSEISYERRNHYSWLGYWPQQLLSHEYPAWAGQHGLKNVLEQ
jgi:PelA/Pel-15E family pectate lyase